jgi:pyruvate/2-oxoglutarate dehydrogenase complex dihydrolipoamide acyltransferase (E2) component
MSVHNRLVANGVDPRSDQYFEEIDKRVRAAFPDEFAESTPSDASSSAAPPENKPQPKSVAAPVVRASAPRKVVLTESAARIARTLGVPLEEYARQVALLGDKNG